MIKASSSLKVGMIMLLALCLLIPSCKKSTPASSPEDKEPEATAPQEGGGTTSKPAEEPVKEPAEEPVKEPAKEPAKEPVKEPNPASASGLAPLPIVLPKPMFEGTPQNIKVKNLEKPLGKPRPPFLAPIGTVNVALEKPITSTDEEPIIGDNEMITDGDKAAADGSYVELGPFLQSVTIDLEAEYNIYAILLWHFHKQARVYFDVIVQVADDPDFITNVRTLYNNDHDNTSGLGIGKDMNYVETSEGRLVDAKGVKARYVRLYSNGSSSNELNHYIEVEVFGKLAK